MNQSQSASLEGGTPGRIARHLARFSRQRLGRQAGLMTLLMLACLSTLLLTADNYVLRLATTVAMYATLTWSWNLIGGYAGYPSFATAAFFGLGAYAAGSLQAAGVPFALAWPLAALLAAIFAGLMGLAILHLRGHYFAIASLVIADVLREVTNVWTDVTGGGMGLSLPLLDVGGVDEQSQFYFLAMLLTALMAFAISWWVMRSRLGVALSCIEQNEDAAQVIGIDTRASKVKAFILSGLVAGAAGAVYASWVTYIDPTDVYDVSISVKPIVMALIGGVGTLMGPLIGALVFLGLEELFWRNVLEFHAGLLGMLVVALVLFLPGGVREARWFNVIHGTQRIIRRSRRAS
ncbi:MAG TPA: branched-chain amino acid ABC transporter permease [Castellaniella sp.]|nr:branched-chain amino acid ABC transporter permease [Castellaniella sp.]